MRSILMKMGMTFKNKDFLSILNKINNDYDKNETYQTSKLKEMLHFCYKHVPYYKKIENSYGFNIKNFPILTKDMIKQDYNSFLPDIKIPFVPGHTGGSTGEPFQYRMSREDEITSLALMYHGWMYAGYNLGDSTFLIGGRSIVSPKKTLIGNLKSYILNEKRYSSFELSDIQINKIINDINEYKPKFIKGYAASLDLIARYILKYNKKIDCNINGIFSTAEMLYPQARKNIEEAFNDSKVFNQYGINDGGVSAFECNKGKMHVDTFRSILEVKNNKILATSLINKAFPFIRYDTGDLGELQENYSCKCGRTSAILKNIIGRQGDLIKLPDNSLIHPVFFDNLFWNIKCRRFQVIKEGNVINILIVPWGDKWVDVNFIKNIVEEKCKNMKVEIRTVDEIKTNNKYRSVIVND